MNVLLYRDLSADQIGALTQEFPSAVFRQTTNRAELVSALDWAEVIFGNPAPEVIVGAPRLRWLQIVSSGFDEYAALGDKKITVTTAHGVHALIIAQHALATILWFARGQPHFVEMQRRHSWDRRPSLPQDLSRQTVGIVGYGEIGRALARMLRPIGPRVLAIKRNSEPRPPELDALLGFDGLDELLGASDHVVIALPLTPLTRGLLDETRLAKLKRGAVLHNVARGGIVDETALLARLRNGDLGGAALDVFAEEPLLTESAFWDLPNVVVTPHLAGHHRDLGISTLQRFRENLRRFIASEPLQHVANFARGY